MPSKIPQAGDTDLWQIVEWGLELGKDYVRQDTDAYPDWLTRDQTVPYETMQKAEDALHQLKESQRLLWRLGFISGRDFGCEGMHSEEEAMHYEMDLKRLARIEQMRKTNVHHEQEQG